MQDERVKEDLNDDKINNLLRLVKKQLKKEQNEFNYEKRNLTLFIARFLFPVKLKKIQNNSTEKSKSN
ncbi:hypothetical protein QWY99_15730 [Flavobacterium branchiarum]|uniref:Uncharacterized protein n=1 Tax=Flavobacterium branchiarum TaxID=1114870 RepID=A0ABV5FLL1_9FLAO|nr:hypothetical protein [Flavobacterium branchiarum]MDN3674491.1 hypothetical protein [Flavobacterium branchiarum]